MIKNEKGFGVVLILLVVVVIGLVSAVGWLVYDRQKAKTDTHETPVNQQADSGRSVETEKTDTDKNETISRKTFSLEVPVGWIGTSTSVDDPCGDDRAFETATITRGSVSIELIANECGRGFSRDDDIGFRLGTGNSPVPEREMYSLCKADGDVFCGAGDNKLVIHLPYREDSGNSFRFMIIDGSKESVSQEEFSQYLDVVRAFKLVP